MIKLKNNIKIFACGLIMGIADIIPGVSGGTMAFILGIYSDLLNVIQSWASTSTLQYIFSFRFKKLYNERQFAFPIALFSGIGVAIILLSSPITYLLENQATLLWAFFFGLIISSIISILNKVDQWNIYNIMCCIIGVVGAYFLVGLVPTETPNHPLFIVFCGALAITAMILPGISGSFILLLLGKYAYIVGAIKNVKSHILNGEFSLLWQNVSTLILFGIGVIIGLVSFVRLLNYLMNKHKNPTVAILIGFMAGSLRKIWPFKDGDVNIFPKEFNSTTLYAILLAIIGFVIVYSIEYTSKRNSKNKSQTSNNSSK